MKPFGQQVSQFVSKIGNEIKMLSEIDRKRYLIPINEKDHLLNAKLYLNDVFNCEVEIYSADDKNLYDSAKKIKFAIPLRPAIYIE
jgi:leucyl-tRNA synthetase